MVGDGGGGVAAVVLYHGAQFLGVLLGERLQFETVEVAVACEVAGFVPDVGDAAAHAGAEVAAGGAQHRHTPAGHILAAVVAYAFDDGMGAAVAHTEALGGDAAEIGLAGGGAVKHHIAHQHIVLGGKTAGGRRVDDDLAAGQPLAHIVVGVPFHFEGDPRRQPRAEALPRRAVQFYPDAVLRQQPAFGDLGHPMGEHGAHHPVGVVHLPFYPHLLAAAETRRRQFNQLLIQRLLQPVFLTLRAIHLGAFINHLGGRQDA